VRRRRPEPDAATASDPAAARLAALRLLNRRDHSERELATKLVERGFERGTAEVVVAALVRERLVDDARHAEHRVAALVARGQGPVRIAQALKELGVAPETVAAVVDARAMDWIERCREVRRRRFGAKAPGGFAERGRQARFLAYRGFSAEQIRAALGGEVESFE
jgi:regulatory protein